jgi:cytochrome P450
MIVLSFFYIAEQLLSTMGDLFGAGTETTTSAFRWAVVYLINNIDVQRKMRKEIDDVVGFGRLPSMSDKRITLSFLLSKGSN